MLSVKQLNVGFHMLRDNALILLIFAAKFFGYMAGKVF